MVTGSIGCWAQKSSSLVLFVILFGVWGQPVHAQDQVTILDVMYTATKDNTSDSHYRVMQKAGTPTNWRSPIDYAAGKMHARVDVISKPSNKKTLFNICFEGTPSYACLPYQPMPYTGTGVFEWEPSLPGIYQYNMVDWSKPISKIALILKDEAQNKPQGSPDFYPTTLHVTLTLVRPGATFKPPAIIAPDAGMPKDAGMPDAGDEDPIAGSGGSSRSGSGGSSRAGSGGSNAGSGGSGGSGGNGGSGAPIVPPMRPMAGSGGTGGSGGGRAGSGGNAGASAGSGGMVGAAASGAAAQGATSGTMNPPATPPAAGMFQPPATSSDSGGCAINTSRGPGASASWWALLAAAGCALWLRRARRS